MKWPCLWTNAAFSVFRLFRVFSVCSTYFSVFRLFSVFSLCSPYQSHDYVCSTFVTLGSRSCKLGLCALCLSVMAAGRPDVLKVFLGNLVPDINKPKLRDLFSCFDMEPAEVIVPSVTPGRSSAIAFVVFNTPDEAQQAIRCVKGLSGIRRASMDIEDLSLSSGIHAHRGASMGVCISC